MVGTPFERGAATWARWLYHSACGVQNAGRFQSCSCYSCLEVPLKRTCHAGCAANADTSQQPAAEIDLRHVLCALLQMHCRSLAGRCAHGDSGQHRAALGEGRTETRLMAHSPFARRCMWATRPDPAKPCKLAMEGGRLLLAAASGAKFELNLLEERHFVRMPEAPSVGCAGRPGMVAKKQPLSPGFWRFSRKNGPWKEWGRYPRGMVAEKAATCIAARWLFSCVWRTHTATAAPGGPKWPGLTFPVQWGVSTFFVVFQPKVIPCFSGPFDQQPSLKDLESKL